MAEERGVQAWSPPDPVDALVGLLDHYWPWPRRAGLLDGGELEAGQPWCWAAGPLAVQRLRPAGLPATVPDADRLGWRRRAGGRPRLGGHRRRTARPPGAAALEPVSVHVQGLELSALATAAATRTSSNSSHQPAGVAYPPAGVPGHGRGAASSQLASRAGHRRMRAPAGANQTRSATGTPSTLRLRQRFRTTGDAHTLFLHR
jgi:hypothetical protein